MQKIDDEEQEIVSDLAKTYRQKSFGEHIFYDKQFSINLIELLSKSLEIEIRFVIVESGTLCMIGDSFQAPSYDAIMTSLEEIGKQDEEWTLDIHNHPVLNSRPYPSLGDLQLATKSPVIAISSRDGICFFQKPKAVGPEILKKRIYDSYEKQYLEGAIPGGRPWLVNDSPLKLSALNILRAKAYAEQIYNRYFNMFWDWIMEPNRFDEQHKVMNVYLKSCLINPKSKFSFRWNDLENQSVEQIGKLVGDVWK